MVAGIGYKNRTFMMLSCEKERVVVGEECVVEDSFAFVFVLFHF